MKIYIAGKVSKDSIFGTHHWRDNFCDELTKLSGIALENLDPLKAKHGMTTPQAIFHKDCQLINKADIFLVYLSDDISVGGSQEILIARYLRKPVIGYAPVGGKFNGSRKEMLGVIIDNFQDPFVYSTCDIVCGTVQELAVALQKASTLKSTGMQIIDDALRAGL